MLENDESGVLTVEFSIVFTISILVVIIILNLFILMYERVSEVVIENSYVIDVFQKDEDEIEIKYKKEKEWIKLKTYQSKYKDGYKRYIKEKNDFYEKKKMMKIISKKDYEK